jgi:two-component system, response regulator FlrC
MIEAQTDTQTDAGRRVEPEPVACAATSMRLMDLARRVAVSDCTVLIVGESGTGKEVLARFIHRCSPRSRQPFIAVNCAAIPENMLEAMLFGYERGAFTGAHAAHPGKFEQAQGGTLLLDEITEMPLGLQAKLLRVLQEREVERLGGRTPISLDVRVLATTNRRLREEVAAGRFREDLYYRLNVLSILVPPLRERATEIPLLFRHFLDKYSEKFGKPASSPSKHLLDAAANYPWPGNLRELENFVKRYVILEDDEGSLRELIEMSSARQRTSPRQEAAVPREQGLKALVRGLKDEAEMEAIADALEKTRWCRKDAAKMLGISYKALLYKMRQFNLDTPRTRRTTAPVEEPTPVGAIRNE